MRAPSSFHSTAAALGAPSAASSDGAVLASIGCTGRPTCRWNAIEPVRTARQRGLGDRREIAREHGRAAHRGCIDPGGRGDRIGDDSGQRPLAQLAAGEHREEAPLVRRGAREERRERLAPHGGRAGSARGLDRRERAVDVGDLERRRGAGAGRSRSAAQPTPVRRWRSSPER